MKVIIEHDEYCHQSERGKLSWIRAFENLQRKAGKKFDQLASMKALSEEWAELARSTNCNCGAEEEMKRREEQEKKSRTEVPMP